MKPIALMMIAMFAAAAAHAADNPKSVELARAMRSDEIAAATAKYAFLSGSMGEGYNSSCVKRFAFPDYTDRWGRVYDDVLTPQEVDTSLAFFQSDAGVKYVEGIIRRLRARQGKDSVLPEIPGTEAITEAQMAKISGFTSSDTGRKVLGKEVNLSHLALALAREMRERIEVKCGKK